MKNTPYKYNGSLTWLHATCPICGQDYSYNPLYKPRTCLSIECVETQKSEGDKSVS